MTKTSKNSLFLHFSTILDPENDDFSVRRQFHNEKREFSRKFENFDNFPRRGK